MHRAPPALLHLAPKAISFRQERTDFLSDFLHFAAAHAMSAPAIEFDKSGHDE
jgi:hypothetical protein